MTDIMTLEKELEEIRKKAKEVEAKIEQRKKSSIDIHGRIIEEFPANINAAYVTVSGTKSVNFGSVTGQKLFEQGRLFNTLHAAEKESIKLVATQIARQHMNKAWLDYGEELDWTNKNQHKYIVSLYGSNEKDSGGFNLQFLTTSLSINFLSFPSAKSRYKFLMSLTSNIDKLTKSSRLTTKDVIRLILGV